MDIEQVKKIISENQVLKSLLCVFLIIILIVYFKIFFTIGIRFDDTFLKKNIIDSQHHYIGKNAYGHIHITVTGIKNKHSATDVVYTLPNNIHTKYTVNFKDPNHWDLGIKNIKDSNGHIVFEGEYRKDSPFLFDKNGQILFDENIRVLINGETPYNADYKVSLKNVADLATSSTDGIRGKYEFLILAIFLFVLTVIDIKFPLFFFTFRHFLEVNDPEPSEFYISMQKIRWYVSPVIGIILMVVSIS